MDTSIRPICFGIKPNITAEKASKVGNEKFKRYEYIIYFMAQITRIVHEDSGFAWYAMRKALGLSNDLVNAVLNKYDTEFSKQRTTPALAGDGLGRPMKSFTTRIHPSTSVNSWGTYISTNRDMTAAVFAVDRTPIKPNKYSIFKSTDIIIGFKSTSTIINLFDDFKSQFSGIDLQEAVLSTGIRISSKSNIVPESFIRLIIGGWTAFMKALEFHVRGRKGLRLFITGHSLGGALATLLGFVLSEAKVTATLPIMKYFTSLHVISFGAPTTCNDTARNSFNKHLESGVLTFDRIVTQRYPSLITNIHSILIGNDYIPGIPIGYSHPGYKPLITEDEDSLRPYSMDTVRKLYGVDTTTRFRDINTWPFKDDILLYSDKVKLDSAVKPYMIGAGPKENYGIATMKHVPNFISVAPLPHLTLVHGETLGMINKSAHRTYGIKNPVKPDSELIAYFSFCPRGVKIEYLKPDGSLISNKNGRTRKRARIL